MQLNYNPVDRNSEEYLRRQVSGGRYAMLIVIGFTAANLLVLLLNTREFYLFAASVPYYLTLLAKGLDNGFLWDWTVNGRYTWTAVALSAGILAVYLLLYFLSGKRALLLWTAFGLFVVDTLAFFAASLLLMGSLIANVMDLFIHGWVLYQLYNGARAAGKLPRRPRVENAVE